MHRHFVTHECSTLKYEVNGHSATIQARLRAISEIVLGLIEGIKSGKDVNLNVLRKEVCLKYSISKAPKLVEIIAGLPEEHKAELLPQYVAEQIHALRTLFILTNQMQCTHHPYADSEQNQFALHQASP